MEAAELELELWCATVYHRSKCYFFPFEFCIDGSIYIVQAVFSDTISSRDDRKFDLQGPKRGTRATSLWAQFSWILV